MTILSKFVVIQDVNGDFLDNGRPVSTDTAQIGNGMYMQELQVDSSFTVDGVMSIAANLLIDGLPVSNANFKSVFDGSSDVSSLHNHDSLYLALAGGTLTGDIAMGGNKITGLGTPTADADAVTKLYVDDLVSGTGVWRQQVLDREIDSANIVGPSAGDRYLIDENLAQDEIAVITFDSASQPDYLDASVTFTGNEAVPQTYQILWGFQGSGSNLPVTGDQAFIVDLQPSDNTPSAIASATVAAIGLNAFADGNSVVVTIPGDVADAVEDSDPLNAITVSTTQQGTEPAGDFVGHENEIAEWDGSAWTFEAVGSEIVAGTFVDVADETNNVYLYDGSQWVAKYWESTTVESAGPIFFSGVRELDVATGQGLEVGITELNPGTGDYPLQVKITTSAEAGIAFFGDGGIGVQLATNGALERVLGEGIGIKSPPNSGISVSSSGIELARDYVSINVNPQGTVSAQACLYWVAVGSTVETNDVIAGANGIAVGATDSNYDMLWGPVNFGGGMGTQLPAVMFGYHPVSAKSGITLVAGDEIYLSDTAGKVTNVPPTASGTAVYKIGEMVDTLNAIIRPQLIAVNP